jgi:tetratricopeptide (TPR) repeat protein
MMLIAPCAALGQTLIVDYDSFPSGAQVFENGRLLGETPLRLSYQVSQNNIESGRLYASTLHFRWRSGQTQEARPVFDIGQEGYNQRYVVSEDPPTQADLNYPLYKDALADYQKALSQYRQALADYQQASKQFNDYLASRKINRTLGSLQPKNDLLRFLNSLGDVVDPAVLATFQQDLGVAQDRVQTAKIELDTAQARVIELGGR